MRRSYRSGGDAARGISAEPKIEVGVPATLNLKLEIGQMTETGKGLGGRGDGAGHQCGVRAEQQDALPDEALYRAQFAQGQFGNHIYLYGPRQTHIDLSVVKHTRRPDHSSPKKCACIFRGWRGQGGRTVPLRPRTRSGALRIRKTRRPQRSTNGLAGSCPRTMRRASQIPTGSRH
jgi:hypothetical protein